MPNYKVYLIQKLPKEKPTWDYVIFYLRAENQELAYSKAFILCDKLNAIIHGLTETNDSFLGINKQ
jgi:hypothetical protein